MVRGLELRRGDFLSSG